MSERRELLKSLLIAATPAVAGQVCLSFAEHLRQREVERRSSRERWERLIAEAREERSR